MAYFYPNKETELVNNTSSSGLSAILMQNTPGRKDRQVVACASRVLTDVERQYSQTEREALAVVWAIEKLHLYLFGSHFKLLTDCKAVALIFNQSQHLQLALNAGILGYWLMTLKCSIPKATIVPQITCQGTPA